MFFRKAITRMQGIIIAVIIIVAAVASGIAYYYLTLPKGIPPGGTLKIGLPMAPTTLDSPFTLDSATIGIVERIVEKLVRYNPKTIELEPALAERWEISPDGLVYTFYLRKGVKFHDGTPFNATSVKFNIERVLDPATKAAYSFYLAMIKSVDVVDDYTVKITLKYPHAPFLGRMAVMVACINSPTAVKEWGKDYALHVVGTGPYRLVKHVPGGEVELEANKDYWGGRPHLDRVIFMGVPEAATRVMMLEAGNLDVVSHVPPRDAERLKESKDVKILHTTGTRTMFIGLNVQREPFNDIRVRQAVNYAVDKKTIISKILRDAAKLAEAPVAPNLFGWYKVGVYEYDPIKAKKLLEEAGWKMGADGIMYKDGKPFEVNLHYGAGRYMMDAEVLEAVQSYLKAVGMKVNLIPMEWAAYIDFTGKPLKESTVQMFLLGLAVLPLDVDYGLDIAFHSTKWAPGFNRGFYKNERVDELIELGAKTVDPNERLKIYKEAQEIIMKEAPHIFLYHEVLITGTRSYVKEVYQEPPERMNVDLAYIEKSTSS